MHDILIKNGTVIDGTGKKGYEADVAIKDDRIADIGHLHDERAEIEIDATGKYICPGFIDVNNHSDTYWQIFLEPDLSSLIYQGITTIVGGNCGSSLAPLTAAKNIETIQKWADIKTINLNWLTMAEFLKVIETKKLPVNFATLVGHATMRRGILKDENRNLIPKELNYIKKVLAESFKGGALGMSTGLIYTHAMATPTEELIELAKIIQKYDGVYTSHVRGEKENLVRSVEEAMGKKNWPKMDEVLETIDQAKKEGIDVTFDVFPYTNTGSVLYTILPSWVSEGGKRIMIQRLKNPAIRKKVISEMKKSGFDYSQVDIAISPLNKTLTRKKISEIARSQEKSVEDAILDVLIASEGRVITSMEVLSEDNVRKAIVHPLSMISSNAAGYNVNHAGTGEVVHPRSFGTFPKVLAKYVMAEKILSWEEAIRKMTSFPAENFGIKNRGKIEKKYWADILVIDPKKLESPASKASPYQYSKGIDAMVVNGRVVVEGGKYIYSEYGKVIRK